MGEKYILETHDICKAFAGNAALQNISLNIRKSSVHALIGENGAGKSTFVNIISGAFPATSGYFEFEGRQITHLTPREAQAIGIGVVHQELNLIPEMTVARKLTEQYPYQKAECKKAALKVTNLSQGTFLKDISFQTYQGEIFGLYGLVGAGRTELARCIIGADRKTSGEIEIDGRKVRLKNPTEAIRGGIAYITESRKEFGLMLDMHIGFNVSISVLKQFLNRLRGINRKAENTQVLRMIHDLAIKTESSEKVVRELSGGNQQKVLLARYMLTKPKVLIIDEPTRGVDVGAKVSIYQILNRLKEEGVSILMISSDLPEVMGISDRVLVMYNGAVTGEFAHDELTEESIGLSAFGDKKG